MNQLSTSKRAQVIAALVEGNSINATVVRMTRAAKHTALKLLEEIGGACAAFHNRYVRNVRARRVQCDQLCAFCYAKHKNVPETMRGVEGVGDVWTWVGIDADSKLAISYLVGGRDARYAYIFMNDLAMRVSNRIQLTTDGDRTFLEAAESAFGGEIDYAMLIKIYGTTLENEARYSPAQCIGCELKAITGNPDPQHISTSYVERQNLTMRMSMRRFTRLTNGHSKKFANHCHAVALHFMYYNFCRVHSTLRVTPAMEAGIADHVWSFEELIGLMEASTSTAA